MPYSRPYASGFADYPATTTPINATALNTMDVGIKTANDQFQTVTTAQRTALSPTVGQAVWDSDLKQLMVYMNASGGNAWQPVGNLIVCASTTRPASPYHGQRIYETDTKKSFVYDGSAWVQFGEQPILTTVQRDALGAVTAGTMIYNSTLNRVQVYYDGAWVDGDTFRTVGANKYNNLIVPPCCEIVRTSNLTSYTTGTDITFSSATIDTDGMFSAGSPTRITIQTTGLYLLTYVGSSTGTATITGVYPHINKNGAALAYTGVPMASTTDAYWYLSLMANLTASDYLQARVNLVGGSAYAIKGYATVADTQTRLSATWIGRTS